MTLLHLSGSIADRVIEQARGRRRPLMPDDETVVRVIVEHFVGRLKADDKWPPKRGEADLVDYLVAMIGGLEFEVDKQGGVRLRMVAPDDGMYR